MAIGSGKQVTTYCKSDELLPREPHFAIRAIETALKGEDILVLRIAMFAISDGQSVSRLCNLVGSNTRELSVSVQANSRSSSRAVEALSKCAIARGVKSVTRYYHGLQVGGLNSYHPKLVYIETPTRRIAAIGSGNLTLGRKNIDYIYVFEPELFPVAQAESSGGESWSGTAWISCVTNSLNSASFTSDYDSVSRVVLDCGRSAVDNDAFLLPTDSRRLLMRMSFLAASSRVVRIVTQGFNSDSINFLVRQALEAGKSVQILLDDDIFWVSKYSDRKYMNEKYEYDNYLVPLISLGAQVRFAITNHNDIVGNFQHSKAYIFSGDQIGIRVLVGSANATTSAFRDNLEVLMGLPASSASAVNSWFEALWAEAVPHRDMPSVDPFR